jgi:putative DNA primase/helicase
MELKPQFDDGILEPQTITDHVDELIEKARPIPHAEVLANLTGMIEPVDFRELAELDENENLGSRHFLIITVDQVLRLAKKNQWGLCRQHDFIYLYNGAFWRRLDAEELKVFLGEAAEKMGVDKFKAQHFLFREQLYKQFLALAHLPRPERPKDVVLVNLLNGTFEITPQGTRLREFNPADFLTYQLPFEYNPEAEAPMYQAYLDKVQPDRDRQKILAEYLGYLFIQPQTLKLEKTLLLYGTGANGKSVFFEAVNALLGSENVSSYSLQNLTRHDGYQRAELANKLVNYASEINGNLEASIFKQLVSGEPVEARQIYGKPFTLTNYAKLIFNCNELPKDVEHTNAYFRRFLIIPFDVTIPEGEQDRQLAQKVIASELPGVFNWVLQGLNRLLEQKQFTDCQAVREARQQYERQSDSVKMFVEEMGYQASPTAHELIKELYLEYRVYCNDDGFKPVNKSNFIKRLQGFGVVVEKRNVGNVAFVSKSATPF